MSGAPGSPAAQGERIAALDVLRGLAIAAVVARHVSWRMLTPETLASPGGPLVAAVHLASGYGVPLFVAVSTFSLVWRHAGPLGGPAGYLGFLRSRAVRLLPAYLLWSIVSLAAHDVSLLLDPATVASTLLAGTADVQFYFVPMIFELFVLWPLLRPLLRRPGMAGALVMFAAGAVIGDLAWRGVFYFTWTALQFFAVSVAAGAGLTVLTLQGPATGPRPLDGELRPSTAGLAVLLMLAAAVVLVRNDSHFLALAAGTASREWLYYVSTIFGREPMAYATLLTGALAIVAGPLGRTRLGSGLAALGRASYGIYLVHLLIASTFVYRFFDLGASGTETQAGAALRLGAVWLVTLAGSFACTQAVARIPRSAWMVGKG